MTKLIYIHGFNSSSSSVKAGLIRGALTSLKNPPDFVCPSLPHKPNYAISILSEIIKSETRDSVTLMGSSLGGFYATWLANHFGCKAILINPAITPHVDLRGYLGCQRNFYTQAEYNFTCQHLDELEGLYVRNLLEYNLFFLMHTTGDDLLDWRVARSRYLYSQQLIVWGGDHGFSEFDRYLQTVFKFAQIT